jgi:hypothetical protein
MGASGMFLYGLSAMPQEVLAAYQQAMQQPDALPGDRFSNLEFPSSPWIRAPETACAIRSRKTLMPSVTVDVADLEALLFATSGIKDLEAALDQRRRNPMVASTKGKMEGAHDRLSTAWRRAKREAEWPKKLVTEADIAELRAMFTDREGQMRAFVVLDEYPTYFVQEMLLVESGPLWEGYQVEWPAPAEHQFVRGPTGGIRYGARLSHYGLQVLGIQESDLVRSDHTIGHGAQAREGELRPISDIVRPIVQRIVRTGPV